MKKYLAVLLSLIICASTVSVASAKSTTNSQLASAIRLYKAKDYAQCYTTLTEYVKKDPSNAVAYYYLAMTSAQVGKKNEAVSNYDKVIELAPSGKLQRYAQKGKICLIDTLKCNEESQENKDDAFIRGGYGSGWSNQVRSDYEKHKIENLMREMNRNNDVTPSKFREYKDFSSAVPTNDEIVEAMRVLQRAGLSEFGNTNSSVLSLLNNNNSNSSALDFFSGNSNLSPQVIQALMTSQMGF